MNYAPGFDSRVSDFQQFYYDAYRTWSIFYSEAYRDVRAYAGDNWTNQERTYLRSQKRTILELNRIRRIINLYSGYERENRKSIVVGPLENSDQATADQLSDVMLYTYDKGGAYQATSDCFEHQLKSGLGILGLYMSYDKDKINGDIKFYYKPFNAVMLDPYMTRRDMQDCDQAATRDLLSKEQVKLLLPWVSAREIDLLPTGIRDNKYQYLGVYRQYNSTYIAKHLVTYDQYWKVIRKPVKLLVDIETGESREWKGDKEDEENLQYILRDEPTLKLINSHKRSVELNIIVAGVLFYTGPDPTGLDDYPFRPMICYFEPLIDTYDLKIQGVVRAMRDAQRLYNKKWSQLTDYNESILNTGWIVKNGAVLDPNMLYQTGQGRVITMNDTAEMSDIIPIRPAELPQTALMYSDRIEKDLVEIPGGSEELMGISSSGDTQISGKLAQVRASNGLKGNRGIFDNMEFTCLEVGKLVLECIQLNYSPGKIKRITGKEPTAQINSQAFEKYDCVIKQSVLTQTQQEAYYYELCRLREIGIAIPDQDILEAAPLQNKTEMLEKLKAREEVQMQQAQELHQAQMIEAKIGASKADEQSALAQERRARVLADIGLARERISESHQNEAKAFLDGVEAIKRIQGMDIDNFVKAYQMQQAQKAESESKTEQTLQKDMNKKEQLKGDQNGL